MKLYSPGEIIHGKLKDGSNTEVELLIICARPDKYHLVNIPCCISIRYWNEPFINLIDLHDWIKENIDVSLVDKTLVQQNHHQ